MKTNMVIATVAALWTVVSTASAQPSGTASLIVLSKADRTLAVVDPKTLQVLGKAPSGPDPHEVITSSDGRMAYIANYNGGGNIITPIDLVAMKALPPIDLGPLRAPHGLTFAGGKLWFTAEGAKAVGTYDPATGKYGAVVLNLIRVAGVLTLIALGLMMLIMRKRNAARIRLHAGGAT